jgi:hypothetical protein
VVQRHNYYLISSKKSTEIREEKWKNIFWGWMWETNSIGSAIVRCDGNKQPVGLIALHNRIFQEMVEADTRVPKNKKRREKRGARN